MTKRIGHKMDQFLSYENFDKAEKKARKNKTHSTGVKAFDRAYPTAEARNMALLNLIEEVRSGNYHSTPPVMRQKVTQGGKVRNLSIVPYFPDIVYAHAILNVIEERFEKSLIYDVYSYNRGTHLLAKRLQKVIHNWPDNERLFILKIDIKKFYESIVCDILKKQISDKFIKDQFLINAIFEILDTLGGLTIGWLLSQLFSSTYLNPLDRFVKNELKVKRYYRYADDILLLHTDKSYLHTVAWIIKNFMWYELGLEAKYWQVFDIKKRQPDYVGFVFFRSHTRVRKKTKKSFIKRRHNPKSVASYMGIMKWCNSRHLVYKILEENNYAKRCTA